MCLICGGTPCEWLEFGSEIDEQAKVLAGLEGTDDHFLIVDDDGVTMSPSDHRKALYKAFTYIKYGHLGRGNRMAIPEFVKIRIKDLHPDESVVINSD